MCVVGEFNEVFWGIHRIKGDILIFGKRLLNLIRSNICVFLEQTRQDKFYFHFRFYQQSFSLSLTFRILIWKTAQSHIKILDKTHIVKAAQIFSLKDFRFNLQLWKGFFIWLKNSKTSWKPEEIIRLFPTVFFGHNSHESNNLKIWKLINWHLGHFSSSLPALKSLCQNQ